MASQADRRRITHQRIVRAARKLFKTKGFDSVSIDDVVAKAKVAKGTFYLHFPSKLEVAYATTDEDQADLARRTRARLAEAPSPIGVAVELLNWMGTWFEENQSISRPLLLHALEHPRPSSPDATWTLLTEILGEAQRRGEMRPDIPPEAVAGLLLGSVVQLVLAWIAYDKPGRLADWFGLSWKIFLEGIRPHQEFHHG
jgi:AcrR family transcriptional regulator